MDLKYWIACSLWKGVTPRRLENLLALAGDISELFSMGKREWLLKGLPAKLYKARVSLDSHVIERVVLWGQQKNQQCIGFDSVDYPPLLKECVDAPFLLYTKGNIECLNQRQVAIVGARRATPYAKKFAYGLASDLCRRLCCVTSGLALGIDAAAHKGALAVSGGTIAVLGNGLNTVYPSVHQALAEEIEHKGVLVSELLPDTPPKACFFPRRNRIVSGLSSGVVIVQAAQRSGSLITARLALEQNREVMAVPGEASSSLAAGCHQLLRDGAGLVEKAEDVFHCMGWDTEAVVEKESQSSEPLNTRLSVEDRQLLACISTAETTLLFIEEAYNGGVSQIIQGLVRLELFDCIEKTDNGYRRV